MSTEPASVQSANWKDCVRLDSDAVEVAIDEWQKLCWSAGKASWCPVDRSEQNALGKWAGGHWLDQDKLPEIHSQID
jgi:hypothetical protein